MPNVWKWTAKDKAGKVVESAPGLKTFQSRGPESEREMRASAQQILNSMMQLDWEKSGRDPKWDNPEYRLDSIEPVGDSDYTAAAVGLWRPPGESAPVALPVPDEEVG